MLAPLLPLPIKLLQFPELNQKKSSLMKRWQAYVKKREIWIETSEILLRVGNRLDRERDGLLEEMVREGIREVYAAGKEGNKT